MVHQLRLYFDISQVFLFPFLCFISYINWDEIVFSQTSKVLSRDLQFEDNRTLLNNEFHPDDYRPMYQEGFRISNRNIIVKKLARTKSQERIKKIQEYCNQTIPKSRSFQLANKYMENTNKYFFFDFYYSFLYCQMEKVSNYIQSFCYPILLLD